MQIALKHLITKTSSSLPNDVISALEKAYQKEAQNSAAQYAFDIMLKNLKLAKEKKKPLCQDTGQMIFYIKKPSQIKLADLRQNLEQVIIECTKEGILRQNSVNPLTNENTCWNVGEGSPQIYWEEWDEPNIDIRLILKGGGCENVSSQFALPDPSLKASRDFDGVKKVVLQSVVQAQGKGCGPGILSVIIGGDRGSSYAASKKLFLRKIGTRNNESKLKQLEDDLLKLSNQLGIGPMGFGGEIAVLDVFCDVLNRVPASYFVTISYMCWAFRRHGFLIDPNGKILKEYY
jgi:fumarate hydratase class I